MTNHPTGCMLAGLHQFLPGEYQFQTMNTWFRIAMSPITLPDKPRESKRCFTNIGVNFKPILSILCPP